MPDEPIVDKVTLATPEELKALEDRTKQRRDAMTPTPDYTHLRELLSKVERYDFCADLPTYAGMEPDKFGEYYLFYEVTPILNALPAILDRLEALERVREAAEGMRAGILETRGPCVYQYVLDFDAALADIRNAK